MKNISSLSDAELLAMAGGGGAPASPLAHLSDDELLGLSKQQSGGWLNTGMDIAKSAGTGLAQGALGVAGFIPQVSSLAREGANRYLFDPILGARPAQTNAGPMPPDITAAATPQALQKSVEGITGEFYKPQTTVGKYAHTVGEFVPGAVMGPGGVLGNAIKYGVIPGVASEAAGQVTEGSRYEPLARGIAAVAAGGTAALATRPGIETRMTAQATRGATDADIGAATQLMRDAQGRGVQLTWPEALQQVTGGATQAGRLQRVIESTKEGGAVMAPAMAQRPDQMRGAVNSSLDRIAPASEPTQTAMRSQEAAQRGIANVNGQINALETPYYDAARTRTVPPRDLQFISQDPAFQQALQNVRADPIRNKDIVKFGANEVPTLIAVRKELGRMEANAMKPGVGMDPDRELARGITPIQNRLDQIITTHAPEYGQALGVGAGLREQVLNPMQRGPVGQIAQAERLPQQVEALFPARPMEGTGRETSRAIGVLNGQDAAAAPALARQHLASTFAEASQNYIPGANQWGGAKWAAQVAGNPLQREVLQGNLAALPNGQRISADIQNLLQVMEATGKRQQPGTMTAFNASDLKDMAGGGLLSAAADAVRTVNPVSFMKQVKENMDRARLGSRAESVARGLLAGPDDAAALLRTARQNSPEGAGARAAIGLLMGTSPTTLSSTRDLKKR
ncbi:MAG: hypothetical protein JWM36_4735 [Hyphomicrobiales bacterium]|nr:hypothetical protein [Hyphomicrobiales bacterium]